MAELSSNVIVGNKRGATRSLVAPDLSLDTMIRRQ